jgi:aminopeptidase-like protein
MMRTKYGTYPEYHTSLDDLENVVTPDGLQGGYNVIKNTLIALEKNQYPLINTFCEPHLGKRGLYPTLSKKESWVDSALMMDLITWSDGKKSLLEVAEICEVPIWEFYPIIEKNLGNLFCPHLSSYFQYI